MYKSILKTVLNQNQKRGFTLIELLVTMVIVGILAALAAMNILQQVGKAREAEMKNAVGTVSRAQMAYHWENQVFCCAGGSSDQILTNLSITMQAKYIDSWTFDNSSLDTSVTFIVVNDEYDIDSTRGYSGAVFYDALGTNEYQSVICQTFSPSRDTTAPNAVAPHCAADAERIN